MRLAESTFLYRVVASMSSSSLQYHFVSTTASNFNFCVVLQLSLAILSSLYDTDVSAAIAVMGIIAILNYNVGMLFLVNTATASQLTRTTPSVQFLFFAPATCIVDIVRMVSVSHHYATAGEVFFILLRMMSMLLKVRECHARDR